MLHRRSATSNVLLGFVALVLVADWTLALRGPRVLPRMRFVDVTVTYYSSTRDQTDGSPFVTASGERVDGRTLAVSTDLLRRLPFGTTVYVAGHGQYVVKDVMHPRWRRRVDVWLPSRGEAIRRGVRRGILVYYVDAEGR